MAKCSGCGKEYYTTFFLEKNRGNYCSECHDKNQKIQSEMSRNSYGSRTICSKHNEVHSGDEGCHSCLAEASKKKKW